MSEWVRVPIRNLNHVPTVVREHCKTCSHSYDPRELLAGLCSNCWVDRTRALDSGNFVDAVSKAVCQNCNRPVWAAAYRHWDAGAKEFLYLCIPCGDDAIAKAEQYRGTIFLYEHERK